ncbi:hypothetical protein UlMin_018696 [Ulmus minor]
MNLGDMQTTDGVASILQDEDNDVVNPHLVRVKSETGGDESDEEREPSTSKASSSKKKSKDGDEDGSKKKKDPDAPKRAMSSFMFFSQMERYKTNPEIAFTKVAIVLGDTWKNMLEGVTRMDQEFRNYKGVYLLYWIYI